MEKLINYFSRVLVALLLCTGVVATSCEGADPFGGENTEQDGGGNDDNQGGEDTGEGSDMMTNTFGGVTLTVSLRNLTETGVAFYGEAVLAENYTAFSFGILYSEEETFTAATAQGIQIVDIYGTNYSVSTSSLKPSTTYYYTSYIKQGDLYKYGEIKSFTTKGIIPVVPSGYTNLSAAATANCYIISQGGSYCLLVTKGNQPSNLLHSTESASLLWETFGTSVAPSVGDLIKSVSYKDGYITFQTADTFKEGNAVIAAKDALGNILWSWHIWLTDQPQAQEYYNNAGTMMDRNLGATSATPGDVGALGLLYQWGRKDPFLGSSSISSSTVAKSTIAWPSAVESSSSNGTIAYATVHPTTFITSNSSNYDWYYTGSSSTDNTRWTTSSSAKSIYDPCPAGWRVPDGGSNGVWSKALGSSSSFTNSSLYNSTKGGMNFSGKFGSASTIWYPASGYRYYSDGGLDLVGSYGLYWSASPNSSTAYYLYFYSGGRVHPSDDYYRAYGYSVRCLQE